MNISLMMIITFNLSPSRRNRLTDLKIILISYNPATVNAVNKKYLFITRQNIGVYFIDA